MENKDFDWSDETCLYTEEELARAAMLRRRAVRKPAAPKGVDKDTTCALCKRVVPVRYAREHDVRGQEGVVHLCYKCSDRVNARRRVERADSMGGRQ